MSTTQEEVFNPNKYWEERLAAKNNLQGVGYLSLGKIFNVWSYKTRKFSFNFHLDKNNISFKGKKAIDIGSGTGFWIETLKEKGATPITGVDLTEVAVKSLKETFPYADFKQGDIGEQQLPVGVEAGAYDVVTCIDVLFHVVDDARFEKAIANISSLLKPGGYFIFSDLFLTDNRTIRGRHQVMRSETTLLNLFKKYNLDVVDRGPFLYLSNGTINTKNVFIKAYWWMIHNTVRFFTPLGYILGPITYWLEKIYIKKSTHSPTSQIAILRKK